MERIKAAWAWVYNWITVIAGIAVGGVSVFFELLDAFTGIDLTPLLPGDYAAKVVAGVALLKALHAFAVSRKAAS